MSVHHLSQLRLRSRREHSLSKLGKMRRWRSILEHYRTKRSYPLMNSRFRLLKVEVLTIADQPSCCLDSMIPAQSFFALVLCQTFANLPTSQKKDLGMRSNPKRA